jgi:tRNA (cmo5U34)-methyltransferase
MSEFKKSEWAEGEHAQEFMENADKYILERKKLLEILESFFKNFIVSSEKTKNLNILDLGCGNGALSSVLVKIRQDIKITLVDGSEVMLKNAKENFKDFENFEFIHISFQDLIKKEDNLSSNYDFIVSSLAIHHLYGYEKKSLFQFVYDHLVPGGYFLNIDTIQAPNEDLENWYRILWREWIEKNEQKDNLTQSFSYLPEKYKNNPDNHPDRLDIQLKMLKNVGFENIDCYYKYGIFSIFGGKK